MVTSPQRETDRETERDRQKESTHGERPGAEPFPRRDAAGFCIRDPEARAWSADAWLSGQRGSATCGPGVPDLNTAGGTSALENVFASCVYFPITSPVGAAQSQKQPTHARWGRAAPLGHGGAPGRTSRPCTSAPAAPGASRCLDAGAGQAAEPCRRWSPWAGPRDTDSVLLGPSIHPGQRLAFAPVSA